MTRECHVRFCERPRVKFPRPTDQGDGYALWSKRLEVGTFAMPHGKAELTLPELGLVLDGIEWKETARKRRFALMRDKQMS